MGFDRKDFSQAALRAGYRSGLERVIDEQFIARHLDSQYEQAVITYTKPEKKHKYHPDFRLPCGAYVESKGRFMTSDRQRHLLIKQQQPNIEIRFVFSNAQARLGKGSKTTMAMWAEKNGFKWANKLIPEEWFSEKAPSM